MSNAKKNEEIVRQAMETLVEAGIPHFLIAKVDGERLASSLHKMNATELGGWIASLGQNKPAVMLAITRSIRNITKDISLEQALDFLISTHLKGDDAFKNLLEIAESLFEGRGDVN